MTNQEIKDNLMALATGKTVSCDKLSLFDEAACVINELENKLSEQENPEPLTLAELREMFDDADSDNAVWFKRADENYYTRALLDYDNERGIFAVWHGGTDQSNFPVEADYGKTWLTYRTKPERSGE